MNNKIILFTLLLVLINACSIGKANKSKIEIKFVDKKFDQVLERAQAEDKIVFIDFWASWCGPCRSMDEEVLSDPELIKFFNTNFINMKLDAESEDAILPKINYDVRSLPSYVWVLPNGNMLHTYKGTTTIANFIAQAKSAIAKRNMQEQN